MDKATLQQLPDAELKRLFEESREEYCRRDCEMRRAEKLPMVGKCYRDYSREGERFYKVIGVGLCGQLEVLAVEFGDRDSNGDLDGWATISRGHIHIGSVVEITGYAFHCAIERAHEKMQSLLQLANGETASDAK